MKTLEQRARNIRLAFASFSGAAHTLLTVLEHDGWPDWGADLSEAYPFERSFDEVVADINEWALAMDHKIKERLDPNELYDYYMTWMVGEEDPQERARIVRLYRETLGKLGQSSSSSSEGQG